MDESTRSLGRFIRTRREALGLNQTELGDAIGREQKYVSELERGVVVNLPSPDAIHKLASTLRCEPDDLLAAAGYIRRPRTTPPPQLVDDLHELRRDAEAVRESVDALVRQIVSIERTQAIVVVHQKGT